MDATYIQLRCNLNASQMQVSQSQNTFSVRGGWVGGATAYLGGATAYLVGVGGKMNLRIRLTSAKIGVGVEVEAELGNKKLTE